MSIKEIEITWSEFKKHIHEHLLQKKGIRLCRGQSNSLWNLKTSFHRNTQGLEFKDYFNYIPTISDWAGSIIGKDINVSDPYQMASFLALLQHHGFPTPLLDWTISPYIASYFAFSEINLRDPQFDNCAIYIFNHVSWNNKWKPNYDYTNIDPHISILRPNSSGNLRQIHQQGVLYMYTNQFDIEAHIVKHQNEVKETYLEKYIFSVKEKRIVMEELELMGITAFSLFGHLDGLCKYFKESIFLENEVGRTPKEKMDEFLEHFQVVNKNNSV